MWEVDACKDCHTKAYEVWKNSKHANAYVAIDKGRKGQEKDFVSRVYDPEVSVLPRWSDGMPSRPSGSTADSST